MVDLLTVTMELQLPASGGGHDIGASLILLRAPPELRGHQTAELKDDQVRQHLHEQDGQEIMKSLHGWVPLLHCSVRLRWRRLLEPPYPLWRGSCRCGLPGRPGQGVRRSQVTGKHLL